MQKRQVISEQEEKQKAEQKAKQKTGQNAKQNAGIQRCEIEEKLLVKIADILMRDRLLSLQERILFEQYVHKG